MEYLLETLNEVQLAEKGLTEIYQHIHDTMPNALAVEQERIRQQFIDLGGKLLSISQIRGTE